MLTNHRFISLFVLLWLSVAVVGSVFSVPLLAPDRVWFRLEPKLYESLKPQPDGAIAYPTGNKALDDLMREFNVTALLPTYSHDAKSLKDPIFHSLGMERDYRFITSQVPARLDPLALSEALEMIPGIEFAEPVYRRDANFTPNDWALTGMNSWGIDSCHCQQAWDIQRGDSTVLVTTIDTGVDYNHPDLVPNIMINPAEDINHNGRWTGPGDPDSNGIDEDSNGFRDDVIGWNFVSYVLQANDTPAVGEQYAPRNNNPMDVHGHGTHVCGSIAARTNNGTGVAAASFNVKTLCVRAGFAWINGAGTLMGSGYDDDFVAAIQYSVNRGSRIISISFGGAGSSTNYQIAVNYARSHNCLMLAAAGNSNDSALSYPAAYNGVVAVAALGLGNERATFSNFGRWVDISAPGVSIWSTMVNNVYHRLDYTAWSGTSMASPTAASVAALVLSRRPSMSADTLEAILRRTATNIATQNPNYIGLLGVGLVNADSAVRAVSTIPVTISVPNGGEVWRTGSTQTIIWSAIPAIQRVRIELNRSYPGTVWETITNSTVNTGSYSWLITGTPTSTARIRIVNTIMLTQGDTSDANFSIFNPPIINVTPTSLTTALYSGDTAQRVISITNTGGSLLNVTASDTGWNYTYRTSNEPGGPVYSWIDATAGTAGPTGDDATTGPFVLPFTFPYFGRNYNRVWMCTNGWLSLDSTTVRAYTNDTLPTPTIASLISPYWDDLYVGGTGTSRYLSDAANHRAIFAWTGIRLMHGSASQFSFEAVLSQDGSILFQYGTMNLAGSAPSATVGIQNSARSRWQQVSYNTTVPSNYAILFTPQSPWVSWSPFTFSIPVNASAQLPVTFDARGRRAESSYRFNLRLTNNSPVPAVVVPLTMNVVRHYVPVPSVNLLVKEFADTLRFVWRAVHINNEGAERSGRLLYRVERNDTSPFTTTGWSIVGYQSDTTFAVPKSSAVHSYYRVTAQWMNDSVEQTK